MVYRAAFSAKNIRAAAPFVLKKDYFDSCTCLSTHISISSGEDTILFSSTQLKMSSEPEKKIIAIKK